MAEPFKNMLSATVIKGMARHLARTEPDFNKNGFISFACDGLDDLELKERSDRITDGLERYLPKDLTQAADIMVRSLEPDTELSLAYMDDHTADNGIRGWPVMPMADYIARHGLDNVEFSLGVLREMTMRSSSEFAIRPFLDTQPEASLKILHQWCNDENHHVRRLVSEGSRPRLPWGMRLNGFVKDPSPVVELLERLKDDPSEYVRRSVANNLNDIAKDHADRVTGIARNWMKGASEERQRLVRHGLRTLIKAGNTDALAVLGYGPPKVTLSAFSLLTPEITLGETLEFNVEITSESRSEQPLLIDYIVHHMRANGKTTPKVFKWKTVEIKAGETIQGTRRHPVRPVTTRRYYPGSHSIKLMINGKTFGRADFILKVPD